MPSKTVILTAHFQDSGTSQTGKPWTRNDFKTVDGERFSTFDASLATILKNNMNKPLGVDYETPNPQYPNSHNVTAAVAFNGNGQTALIEGPPNVTLTQPLVFDHTQGIKPVDRNAGLARAIEVFLGDGENILGQLPALQELALKFAAFGAQGTSFATVAPSSGGEEDGPTN